MSETKAELIKAGLMIAVIAYEWYAMQPYHEPVLAKLWLMIAALARRVALAAGRLALRAEYNYYTAAEAGL